MGGDLGQICSYFQQAHEMMKLRLFYGPHEIAFLAILRFLSKWGFIVFSLWNAYQVKMFKNQLCYLDPESTSNVFLSDQNVFVIKNYLRISLKNQFWESRNLTKFSRDPTLKPKNCDFEDPVATAQNAFKVWYLTSEEI